MNLLTKVNNDSINYADIEIQKYMIKHPLYNGLLIVDTFNRIHVNNYDIFIPQTFINNIIFISSKSFQQNHKILSKQIRKYVNNLITDKNKLIAIGGESYIYGLVSKIPYIYHITNSLYIYNDSQLNSQFYNSNISNNLVNYNQLTEIIEYETVLINQSQLNINLMKIINKSKIKDIIIINCNSSDFWRKIKILSNYKIINRKQFICYKLKYFITVTILVNKVEL